MSVPIYESDNVAIERTFGTVWVFSGDAKKNVTFPLEELPKVAAAINEYLAVTNDNDATGVK